MKNILLLLAVLALFTFGFFQVSKVSPPARQDRSAPDRVVSREPGPARVLSPDTRPGKSKAAAKVLSPRVTAADQVLPQPRPSWRSPKVISGPAAPVASAWKVPLNRKTELTPAEMLMLEIERKRERRRMGYTKSDLPDKYARFHKMIRTREGADYPQYAADYKLTELAGARQVQAGRQSRARLQALTWSERGPANVPGRTRALLSHPDNPGRIWFAGSVSGGIWKTMDAGANWVNKTPDLPNLATTVLAMAPSDPNILYAGTGEGFFNLDATNGDGIFKSTDGGETWRQLRATAGRLEFRNINRIIVDPNDSEVLLACSNVGFYDFSQTTTAISWIMRSTNGGRSWSAVLALPNRIQQLVASPDNFQVQYGTVGATGVIKSTDGGKTWALSNKGMFPTGRVELAIAPTDPSWLYAAAEGNMSSGIGGSDLYQSRDAGENWTLVWEESGPNINWLRGQGWYDNTLAVHPYDKNTVYLGGVQLWKMMLSDSTGRTPRQVITGVSEVNTASFLDFVNLGGQAFDGKLVLGNIPDADRVSVEIRFGPGQSQLAHRFTVGGRGPGVPAQEYRYRDYVTVPFEVWDIKNNRQLMVSFRDQQEDSTFNLLPDQGPGVERREYLYIHASPYDQNPLAAIARDGGHQFRNMYFLWPILRAGATWDPDNLPVSKLVINSEYLTTRLRTTQNLSDPYFEFGGKNANLHVDHHNLIMIKGDEQAQTFRILNANDGGVYVSKPGTDPGNAEGSWIFASSGYNTTQFYGVDKKRDADEYFGGTQDNGTWRSPPLEQASAATSYLPQLGGDGFEVSWNYYDPNKLMGSLYTNIFARSLNGGATWVLATNGLADQGNNAPFISQIGTSRSNPDVLYATGASGVWVTEDFGANWKLSPIRDRWAYNGIFSDVKVSEANNQIIWAGHAISSTGRIQVSTDGGRTFTATSGYEEATLGDLSGLATHPSEDSTAYALFSFSDAPKILKTTDLGQTWNDISGFGTNASSSTGFPDVAVYTLLVMPHDPDILWAGTEIGLVESDDGGATWYLAENGLPAVSIWELKVVDDQVVVATHGRGIWSVTIPELYQPVVFVPYINSLRVGLNQRLLVHASLRSPYDSTLVLVNDSIRVRLAMTEVKDTLLQIPNLEEGLVAVQLKSYRDGEEYVSTIKTIDFFLAIPVHAYANNFNQPSDDFLGTGFSIRQVAGFADGAIHSPHPYAENNDYTYQLKVPIIIAQDNAWFRYRDVALVEPGEPGVPYGNPGFWDYVVVEGSKDGLQWKELEDGYDANYYAPWRAAFDQRLPGNDSMFVAHAVDMSQAFAPGDTVWLRFRLYSDDLITGWGWAIDDLSIQEELTAVASLTLVNASTGADIGVLTNQDTLNLNRVGRHLNIRANTLPDQVGSVVFQLNGTVFGTDNQPPYTLAGDDNGEYRAWTPAAGTYTLTVTPYAEADGKGEAGTPLTLTFTVIKANEVASLVLVNAETGLDIRTLQQGDIIDLKQVGRKLNIRANTLPFLVGSVVFTLDGYSRTENFFPYALAGFNYLRLRYNSWTPAPGSHTLKATPYSRFHGQGEAGVAHQVQFTVVDGQPPADDLSAANVQPYPNPTRGKFRVALEARENLDVRIEIYNLKGIQVHQQHASLKAGSSEVDIDLSAFPDGLYLIKTASERQKFTSFNIIKRQ